MAIRDDYSELYEKLKGPGLDSILRTESLDNHHREAVRIIARLPDPWTASSTEIAEVCQLCISGVLEFLFNVAWIGETARRLRTTLKESSEKLYSPLQPEDLATVFYNQTLTLDRLTLAVNAMSRKYDMNLKGRCIYCQGDLVEVVVDPGGGKPKQLRLQCRQQADPKCQTFDWYLQEVDERKR